MPAVDPSEAMPQTARTFAVALALLLVLLSSGCARRYAMTLSNNNVITTKGRPKLNQAETAFHYTDLAGEKGSIPRFRVKEIAPLR